jgi:uncharacterized protein (TIGR02231 family)
MKLTKLLLLVFTAHCAIAQTSQRNVESKVTKVTVFRDGAQVTRTSHTSIAAGKSDIVFSGISPYVDASSLQVDGEGSFVILGVSPQPNKLREQKKRKEIEDLEKSKEAFQKQLIQHQASLDIYQKEEQMLAANYVVGGANTGLKAADLAAALDLHRTRLRDIKFYEIDYNERIKKVQDTLTLIDGQITALNNNADVSTTDVIVSVAARDATAGDFTLSYVVSNAGWYPSYDLHVDDITKPLTLSYKANVYQNTGEEWKEVKLIFSNGNPSESGIAPVLNPLYLRNLLAYNPVPMRMMNSVNSNAGSNKDLSINGGRPDEVQYIVNGHRQIGNYIEPTQMSTNISFELSTLYTVINDGKNVAVDMKDDQIPASFEYFSVPKKAKKGFLTAHIANWTDYNLMDGEVNLYYEGTYTGKTAFSLANADDTLNLSMGRDKGITINRVKVKEFSKNQVLSDKKLSSADFDITVRNNKKFPVHIVVEDQIPLSTEKEITIDNATYEGATLDEATGKVTWKLDLAPGKEQKLKLSYTVKYPKAYRLQIE